jgi:hypothetical protein
MHVWQECWVSYLTPSSIHKPNDSYQISSPERNVHRTEEQSRSLPSTCHPCSPPAAPRMLYPTPVPCPCPSQLPSLPTNSPHSLPTLPPTCWKYCSTLIMAGERSGISASSCSSSPGQRCVCVWGGGGQQQEHGLWDNGHIMVAV